MNNIKTANTNNPTMVILAIEEEKKAPPGDKEMSGAFVRFIR